MTRLFNRYIVLESEDRADSRKLPARRQGRVVAPKPRLCSQMTIVKPEPEEPRIHLLGSSKISLSDASGDKVRVKTEMNDAARVVRDSSV